MAAVKDRLSVTLLVLRVLTFGVLLMWTLEKLVNPDRAAGIYRMAYGVRPDDWLIVALGVLELGLLLAFLVGLKPRWTRAAVLGIFGLATLAPARFYPTPFDDHILLYYAAIPTLAVAFALYYLRDYDTRWAVRRQPDAELSTANGDDPRVPLCLFLIRLGIFVVLLMWNMDKFFHPLQTSRIFLGFYNVGGESPLLGSSQLSYEVVYLIGALQLPLLLAFVLGIAKRFVYAAIFVLHSVSTIAPWERFLSPLTAHTLLFLVSFTMLGGCFALYYLRDRDVLWTWSGGASAGALRAGARSGMKPIGVWAMPARIVGVIAVLIGTYVLAVNAGEWRYEKMRGRELVAELQQRYSPSEQLLALDPELATAEWTPMWRSANCTFTNPTIDECWELHFIVWVPGVPGNVMQGRRQVEAAWIVDAEAMEFRPDRSARAFFESKQPTRLQSSAGHAAASCDEVSGLAPSGMTITESVAAEPSEQIPVAHCVIRGRIAARTGTDGHAYAVSFELRLPDDWSGRFAHQFNGGNDGAVVPALGRLGELPPGDSALARGFAVVSSDAGHDGAARTETGLAAGNVFGLDFEARKDYGYGAVAKLHPVAIALTEAYYGEPVRFVYGMGTSNGGRHALIAASRMPEAFDGLLAGYPGFHLPRAAIQHAWDAQAFRSVGTSLADAFSRAELDVVATHVRDACDALDGLADGLIFDVEGCQARFDPRSMICEGPRTADCLPESKANALIRILGGPRNSAGEQLYSEWAWDTGIASGNWRTWKLESAVPPWNKQPIIAIMGAGSLAQVFTTPPTPVLGDPASLEQFLLDFDFDRDAPKIDATSAEFPESAMELMTPPDSDHPTLAGLERAGGKLIVFHGVSDPVFSFLDTVAWYEKLIDNNPNATRFVRLYAVPGMPHGPGGVAPDRFDALSALVEWVEQDRAPGSLVASVREDNESAASQLRGASRKLCPWPSFARYSGGDPRSAEAFDCAR